MALFLACACAMGQATILVCQTQKAPIYYLSSSGNDDNDGLSPQKPKQSLSFLNQTTWRVPGAKVLLKRGDVWHHPEALYFERTMGTLQAPITVGAYGDATQPRPIIAYLSRFDQKAWKNEGGGLYSMNFAAPVYRLYVGGLPVCQVPQKKDLQEDRYCLQGGKIWLQRKDFAKFSSVEIIDQPSGDPLTVRNCQYLIFENLEIRGGTSWVTINMIAPSQSVTFQNCTVRQFRSYAFSVGQGYGSTDGVHVAPRFLNLTIDRAWTDAMNGEYRHDVNGSKEGAAGGEPGGDGISFSDGVEGGLVKGCTIINMGHTGFGAGVARPNSPGIKNMIFENNIVDRGSSSYCRMFAIAGFADTCTGNIIRYNYGYDLTNGSHFGGNNNYCYSNIFDKTTVTKAQTGNKQPYAIDTMVGSQTDGANLVCMDNVIANNTIYDSGAGIFLEGSDTGANIIANNLIVGWQAPTYYAGLLLGDTISSPQSIRNNGFWNKDDQEKVIRQGVAFLTADEANALGNAKGNLQIPPMFAGDLIQKGIKPKAFALSASSPYRAAGMDIRELLPKGSTDYFGQPFDALHPSIGAVQYHGIANLLQNPSFETGMTPWKISGAQGAIQADAHSGKSALLLQNVTEATVTYDASASLVGKNASAFDVSGYFKANSNGAKVQFNLTIKDGQGEKTIASKEILMEAKGFTRIAHVFSPFESKKIQSAVLTIRLIGAKQVSLDDMKLVRVHPISKVLSLPKQVLRVGSDAKAMTLPASVPVIIDNQKVQLNVDWQPQDFNTNTAKTYTFNGMLGQSQGVDNPDDDGIANPMQLTASYEVVVKEVMAITSIDTTNTRNVSIGTTFETLKGQLPNFVSAKLENGEEVMLEVEWLNQGYNASRAGEYHLVGKLLPQTGVSNPQNIMHHVTVIVMKDQNTDQQKQNQGNGMPWGLICGIAGIVLLGLVLWFWRLKLKGR